MGVAAVAGFVTSGVSAIYADAATAGTSFVLSKGAAGAIAGAGVSVLNQSNDAAKNGEPLNISPIKIVTDIATDKIADHIAEKAPEIKIKGTDGAKINEATKAASGDAIAKGVDMGVEMTKVSSSVKISPMTLKPAVIINQPDATANKMYISKLKNQ